MASAPNPPSTDDGGLFTTLIITVWQKAGSLRRNDRMGRTPFVNLFLLFFLSTTTGWGTGEIIITYGSTYSGSTGIFFTDAAQVGFDASNTGVIAVGYFTSGFDVTKETERIVAGSISAFLSNFNLLASSSFQDAEFPGYMTQRGQFTEQSIGAKPYLLTLAGVSSFDDAASATEIGLYTDSSLPMLPEGGDPIPAAYDLATTITFDSVLLGTEITESTFDGIAYGTRALPDLPAIWGGATNLDSNWLDLSWFGLVCRDSTSDWAYHYHLGWLFPSGSDPDGFWIWRLEWNSWAYTGATIFPLLWLDSEQKWIWADLLDTGSFTIQIYDNTAKNWSDYDTGG